jgi:hypothetical protein
MKSSISIAALVITAAGVGMARSFAQSSIGTNRVISPAVVASWQSRDLGDGTGALGFLVLWRGAPGWFMRGSSSSGGGEIASGGSGKSYSHSWMSYGDITLTIDFASDAADFPPASTVLTLAGREVPLRDANVVLVDGADTEHPTVVATRLVEPAYEGPDAVAAIVKRSPELFEFLRCDARMPDATVQPMIEAICRRMQP